MASPYTQPTLSGYDSNPPSDDGSQVAANEITWAKHKDKLGDPLKAFIENVDSNVASAFTKRLFNSVSSISSDYTVATSDRGKLLSAANTITITLPAAGTAGSGFEIVIRNDGSGTVTVDGDGSETVNGSATFTLNPKASLLLVSDGTNWVGPFGIETTATKAELDKLDGSGTLGVLDFQVDSTSKTTVTWNFDSANNDLDITTT